MRRQLIATTSLIALAAILVLGIPLGLVESARARGDALGRLEREADGIAPRPRRGARIPKPSPRGCAPGTRRSCAPKRPTTRIGRMPTAPSSRPGPERRRASASASSRRRRRVDPPPSSGVAVRRRPRRRGHAAAAVGLAALQARRFVRPLHRLVNTSARLGSGDFSAPHRPTAACPSSTASPGARLRRRPDRPTRRSPARVRRQRLPSTPHPVAAHDAAPRRTRLTRRPRGRP